MAISKFASLHACAPPGEREDLDSDSDDDSGQVGALAPPLTEQISNILNRYPEGGQILKVPFIL